MATTFRWIHLGIPRNASNQAIFLDVIEGDSTVENAAVLSGRTFGGTAAPLYNNIRSATTADRGGEKGVLDTDNSKASDQVLTGIGSAQENLIMDGAVTYAASITYADGTSATTEAVLAQTTSGDLFLAPPISTPDPTLVAKPILSITLGKPIEFVNVAFAADRLLIGWDDGGVDGTDGADSIVAGYEEPVITGSDAIDGGDGTGSAATGWNDDRIRAGGGNDTINAGAGNDYVDAGSGSDLVLLTGAHGNDTVVGGNGIDTLSGATLTGDVTVTAINGAGSFAGAGGTVQFGTIETVVTGSGNDVINASTNAATMTFQTGAGNDTVTGGSGTETINAGAGNDVIDGGSGADTIDAGGGDDIISLTRTFGNDAITGGEGTDTLNGGGLTAGSTVTFANGSGTLASGTSTASFNSIEAVVTGSNDDVVNAAANGSAASFSTGAGNDLFTGGSGAETVDGGLGNDGLNGGAGNDSLSGGLGDDRLTGGAGNDSLTGGLGNDVFVVGSGDVVTDFGTTGPGDSDFVDLTGFYNDANLAIINAARSAAGLKPYLSPLGWMRADQADGTLGDISQTNGFGADVTLNILNGGQGVASRDLNGTNTGVLCFGADALIETAEGEVAAGALAVGMLVRTRDAGLQPIRWVGRRSLSAADLDAMPHLRPIRIGRGALGRNLPASDLIVSPQHRVLVRSRIAQRMFDSAEVLVAARQLCQIDGIDVATDLDGVTYVHILFDDHQIVFSNGAETESLHPGAEAMRTLPDAAREEILAIFPELRDGGPRPVARPLGSGRMARKLAVRHIQNRRPLVEG